MIIDTLITLFLFIFQTFILLLQPIFNLFPEISYSIGSGSGYIFGSMMQFNSFLPITEALTLAGLALTFKASMFAYEVVFYLMSIANSVRRTFTQFRI